MDMNDPRMRAYRERLNQINEMKRDVADYIRKVAQEEAHRVQSLSMNQNAKRRPNYTIKCTLCNATFEFVYDGDGIPWISDCPICHARNNDKPMYQISGVDQYA